jgi:hypothetical protein
MSDTRGLPARRTVRGQQLAARRHVRRVVSLPVAVTYGEGRWWEGLIAPYGPLRDMLEGSNLDAHHLIPKALLHRVIDDPRPAALGRYVPAIPLTGLRAVDDAVASTEHRLVHSTLNRQLAEHGLWRTAITTSGLQHALRLCMSYYEENDVEHFAEALDEFDRRVLDPVLRCPMA